MEEDASLDDFLDAADGQEAGPDESDDDVAREDGASGAGAPDESEDVGDDATQDADASEAVEDAVRRDPSAVEPAGATYDWTPGGAACEACGEVVERRWRDEPGFVCENCKDW